MKAIWEDSLKSQRTQYRLESREQPKDKRNPESTEVPRLKTVQEREQTEVNGIWQPGQGRKVQKGAHPIGQLGKGSFSGVLKARFKMEWAKKWENEEGDRIWRESLQGLVLNGFVKEEVRRCFRMGALGACLQVWGRHNREGGGGEQMRTSDCTQTHIKKSRWWGKDEWVLFRGFSSFSVK